MPRTLLESWDFFWWFQNSSVDEGCSSFYKNLPNLNSRKVLSDDCSCLIWMSFLQVTTRSSTRSSAASSSLNFSLDRWEMFVPHPLTRQLSSIFEFTYWWLTLIFIDSWLCVKWMWVVRVAARSFSCEQSNSECCLDRWAVFFVLHPFSCQMPTAVEQFENDCWSCFNWLKFYKLQPGWDVSNLLNFYVIHSFTKKKFWWLSC